MENVSIESSHSTKQTARIMLVLWSAFPRQREWLGPICRTSSACIVTLLFMYCITTDTDGMFAIRAIEKHAKKMTQVIEFFIGVVILSPTACARLAA